MSIRHGGHPLRRPLFFTLRRKGCASAKTTSGAPGTTGSGLRGSALDLARRRGTAVLLSGPEDLITDGARVWCVTGGSGRMSLVTGTGCMLSVLCGVFAAVEPDAAAAAALASAFWKICARRAEHLAADRGSGSFRTALLDAANTLTASDAAREAEILTL